LPNAAWAFRAAGSHRVLNGKNGAREVRGVHTSSEYSAKTGHREASASGWPVHDIPQSVGFHPPFIFYRTLQVETLASPHENPYHQLSSKFFGTIVSASRLDARLLRQ
jgi:hypothetical protein